MSEQGALVRRTAVGLSVPVVLAALSAVLPAVLGVRWPDGPGGRTVAGLHTYPALWILAFCVFGAVMQIATSTYGNGTGFTDRNRMWVAAQWGVAGFLAGQPIPDVVSGSPWWAGPWVLAAGAVVLGVLGWWAAGPTLPGPAATGRPRAGAPRLELARDERVLWARSVVSRPLIVLTVVWVLLAAVQAWLVSDGGTPFTAITVAFLAVVSGVQCWVRVRVDGGGVRVEQPLLRRTLITAPIAEVAEASAGRLGAHELAWTRYGVQYQPGRVVYRAVRTGETLDLRLSGGRRFVVTVPDADTAAALLNSELDRRRAPAC